MSVPLPANHPIRPLGGPGYNHVRLRDARAFLLADAMGRFRIDETLIYRN